MTILDFDIYLKINAVQVQRGAKGAAYATKREQAVQLKANGMNNTQIAKNLEVDRKTITRWFLGVGQYPYQITAFFEVPYDY